MENRPIFDYGKLRGRIIEKYGSQKQFSHALQMNEGTLSQKLTGSTFFTQAEILRIGALLDIEPGLIASYFFTPRVKES